MKNIHELFAIKVKRSYLFFPVLASSMVLNKKTIEEQFAKNPRFFGQNSFNAQLS